MSSYINNFKNVPFEKRLHESSSMRQNYSLNIHNCNSLMNCVSTGNIDIVKLFNNIYI